MRKEDAAKLIAGADGKLKLLLVFLFLQGWRISDALRLTWNDIDAGEATVRYRIAKTDQWLTMPLNIAMLGMFHAEGHSYPQIGRVFPWDSRKGVYRDLKPLCQKVGIYFTPHMARHSFATWLHAEGASLQEIMEAGGWRDHKSAMRYAAVDIPRVRATINKIKLCTNVKLV
jgi:integrase